MTFLSWDQFIESRSIIYPKENIHIKVICCTNILFFKKFFILHTKLIDKNERILYFLTKAVCVNKWCIELQGSIIMIPFQCDSITMPWGTIHQFIHQIEVGIVWSRILLFQKHFNLRWFLTSRLTTHQINFSRKILS